MAEASSGAERSSRRRRMAGGGMASRAGGGGGRRCEEVCVASPALKNRMRSCCYRGLICRGAETVSVTLYAASQAVLRGGDDG